MWWVGLNAAAVLVQYNRRVVGSGIGSLSKVMKCLPHMLLASLILATSNNESVRQPGRAGMNYVRPP